MPNFTELEWRLIGVVIYGVPLWLLVFMIPRWLKRLGGGAPPELYCCHCGAKLPSNPTRVMALTDRSQRVYTCRKCKAETVV